MKHGEPAVSEALFWAQALEGHKKRDKRFQFFRKEMIVEVLTSDWIMGIYFFLKFSHIEVWYIYKKYTAV